MKNNYELYALTIALIRFSRNNGYTKYENKTLEDRYLKLTKNIRDHKDDPTKMEKEIKAFEHFFSRKLKSNKSSVYTNFQDWAGRSLMLINDTYNCDAKITNETRELYTNFLCEFAASERKVNIADILPREKFYFRRFIGEATEIKNMFAQINLPNKENKNNKALELSHQHQEGA